MQLLLVDDEAHWVDNLYLTKPWHTIGITAVHKAYSPHEALQIVETHPIDIVLTDILMPKMTGLELIERIHQADKRIKCIILSGYSEFEYAKQAVQQQAVDYLLKPPTDDELLSTVRNAVEQLSREWETVSSYERMMNTLRDNLPLLRGNLLLASLRGKRMPSEEWNRKLGNYGLPFKYGDECALLLIRLEDEFAQYENNGLQLMEYALMNIAEEIMDESMEVWSVKDDHDYITILLKLKDDSVNHGKDVLLEQLAMRLQHKVKLFLKGTISIVSTEWIPFPEQVSIQYSQATSYFRRFVGDEREFLTRLSEEGQRGSMDTLEALYGTPSLIHLLEAGRWDASEEKLNGIFTELSERWSDSWEHCMEAGFEIAAAFSRLAHKNGRSLSEVLGTDMEQLSDGITFRSIGRLREWSLRVLGKMKRETMNEINTYRNLYIQKLQQFVELNLHKDVSLRTIADHVNLHPTHLSKIYKMETGEGISDYLFRLRMDRSCHLLITTDKKVYEIGADIGYMDPAYFIKVFKRHFGATPQEYREQNL